MSHACHRFLEMLQNPHVLLTFDKVHNPVRLPRETTSERPKVVRACGVFHILTSKCALRHNSTFSTSQLPKVVPTWCVLYILTSKCASRQNGVHFFDIATSKSAPNLVCFVHSDFEMCFAPQPRALFRHLNFQKWSEPGVFCTFWLRNVLRATTPYTFRHLNFKKCSEREVLLAFSLANVLCATTACNFSSLIWPAGSARRFSKPTFRPSGATNHWKNTVFCDFPTFSQTWIFFLLRLSLLWSSFFFSSLLFFSLLFSDSSHLCFSSVHIVGSLSSKLPSMIICKEKPC